MIRSRSIPTVLSRITGDGIHAVFLIDSDGELLGSYGNPPPQTHNKISQDDNNVLSSQWPLDASSIGALISEVAGDYSRMGEELLLLDPQYDSSQQRQSSGETNVQKDQSSDGQQQQQQQQNQSSRSSSGGDDESSSTNMQQGGSADGGKSGKKDTNLKSLVIEMDYVSSYLVLIDNYDLILLNCIYFIV